MLHHVFTLTLQYLWI